ncbi:lysophospholipid acyltransferase family protein [Palleronia caenipelagi]|uniref:Lysophospholipid acyltransferase family protein n=1 Tax=Palleronia caenipelagi TaxID=2489174 RepID=A0A547Q328_9RHOB|nr:lysophospholipid acyltransferase family protein [Palleronia caenipelagi]TRD20781.1 lysophospholipid acyltransferase family protein [Palleronia caenipelagi]
MARDNRSDLSDRFQDLVIRGLLGAVLTLPYPTRVCLMGWLLRRVLAPIVGWDDRIRKNLAHVCPDMPEDEIRKLIREVPDNVGRSMIELYSGEEFRACVTGAPMGGPGFEAVAEARAAGRPVALVTAHIGNFDALRANLQDRGYEIAGLYREMNNPRFNEHYVGALSANGKPVFPTNRTGTLNFVKHLARGGMVGILADLYSSNGASVTFFGKDAPTSTAICDWSLKYDAVVVPCYAIRRPDGLRFDLIFDEPVAHRDPVEMMQEINDKLEAVVRQHMGQWFWIHRRWKPNRRRRKRHQSSSDS